MFRFSQPANMMKLSLVLLSMSAMVGLTLAFVPVAPHAMVCKTSGTNTCSSPVSTSIPRSLPIVESAKIVPVAFTSASAALMFRATKVYSSNKVDAAVLLATSALTLFNFGPIDNARLISAKRADKSNPPASSGIAKQRRQAAKTWRSTIRIKIIGQCIGLLWLTCAKSGVGIMRGAATVMAASIAFLLSGGGNSRHNNDGSSDPMSTGVIRILLGIDTILTLSALIAASSPVESTRRAVFAGIYVAGATLGAVEGAISLVTGGANSSQ